MTLREKILALPQRDFTISDVREVANDESVYEIRKALSALVNDNKIKINGHSSARGNPIVYRKKVAVGHLPSEPWWSFFFGWLGRK